MKTATDRIKFALRFSQMDTENLRPGDWLNLRHDLGSFFGEGQERGPRASGHPDEFGGVMAVPEESADKYPEDSIRELQLQVRNLLLGLADRRIEANAIPVSISFAIPHWGGLVVIGPLKDIFLSLLCFILAQQSIDTIMKCPECEQIFYKEAKRQKFCSRRCANLTATKRYYRKKREKNNEKTKKA